MARMTQFDPEQCAAFARRSGRPRRAGDSAQGDADTATSNPRNLPVVAGPAVGRKRSADPRAERHDGEPASAFAAQVLGQSGQKRGLRGGPQVLDHARSAYLDAEWSGHADRRPPKGVITKTEI
jgi:hypothetical protein